MKMLKGMVLLCSVLVTACNSTGVKSESGNAAPNVGPSPSSQAPSSQAPSSQAANSQAPSSAPSKSSRENVDAKANQIELIANRITAVQDHLLQVKAQAGELQLQNQAVLQNLSGIKKEIVTLASTNARDPEGATPEAADPSELNAVLDQITMMANELGTQVQDGPYRIVSSYTAKGQWVLIRYHRYTGETWLADQNQWFALEDSTVTSASEYEVVLLRADKDIKGYVAARIDRLSGASWWLKQNIWQAFIP